MRARAAAINIIRTMYNAVAALFIVACHLPITTAAPSYFALCAAIKDSPDSVKEWVDYHAALGVGKFYLMDTDDPHFAYMEAALAPSIASGLVELYSLPRVNPQTINLLQIKLYAACLDSARNRHQFVGFWDVDEFLVPLDPTLSFPAFLREFEDEGGLAVGWRVVGPSGHVRRPQGGTVLPHYQKCTAWDHSENSEIKTIVNTRYARHPTSDPHTFAFADAKHAVDAVHWKVEGSRNPRIASTWQEERTPPRLALYHYVTKSEEEYREKMRRGSAMGNRKDMEYFKKVAAAATETCDEAARTCAALGLPHCLGERPAEGRGAS